MRAIGLCCVLVLQVAGTGCGSIQKPTAEFRSATVSDLSGSGLTINLNMEVKNPNTFTLPVSGADYTLSLGGVTVVDKAKINPGGTVPASGSRAVTIPVPVTFENLLAAADAIRKGNGEVRYGVDGGLELDSGMPLLGRQRVPIKCEGTLKVVELLKKNWSTILNSPAARKLAQEVMGGLLR